MSLTQPNSIYYSRFTWAFLAKQFLRNSTEIVFVTIGNSEDAEFDTAILLRK